jgi:hypothetical protein
MSAGSRLVLEAAHIDQRGVLRAPFGQIGLNATKDLYLGPGSLTSVSGAGSLVPFGVTEFGEDWLYALSGGFKGVYETAPLKSIELQAPQVALSAGAEVDLSGGGDLLAWEHLPGPGGSVDILAAASSNGAFAIMPARSNLYGSYDPMLSAIRR